MNLFLQLVANGLVHGAMLAVLAVGFGLVYRNTGVFHLELNWDFIVSSTDEARRLGL